jgi:hypothetical protein
MVGSFARQMMYTDGNPGPIPTEETIVDSFSRKKTYTDGNPGPVLTASSMILQRGNNRL